MSDISPIQRPAAPTLDTHTRSARTQAQADTTTRGDDQVELSSTAQLLSKIADLPDIRQGLVDRVRASIDDGTYETEARTDAAIDGLLEDIG
jgi:negative regulator of flagellin synthesis FlgM